MKKLKTKLAIKLATMSMSERVHEAIFIFTILLSLTGDSFPVRETIIGILLSFGIPAGPICRAISITFSLKNAMQKTREEVKKKMAVKKEAANTAV